METLTRGRIDISSLTLKKPYCPILFIRKSEKLSAFPPLRPRP